MKFNYFRCDEECKAVKKAKKNLLKAEIDLQSIQNIIEMQEFLANQARRKAAAETDPVLKQAREDAAAGYEFTAQSFRENLERGKMLLKLAQDAVKEAEKKLKECKEVNKIPAIPPCDE